MKALLERAPYLLFASALVVGLYILVSHRNYLKALVGLYLFQTGVVLFFVLVAFRRGGAAPVLVETGPEPIANPLPHALMLTAIVVGVATLGVGIAILRRLHAETGTIESWSPPSDEEGS